MVIEVTSSRVFKFVDEDDSRANGETLQSCPLNVNVQSREIVTRMHIGAEWLVEATGCREERLRSVDALAALFGRLVEELSLHPLHAPQWHVFPEPGGITGFVMLTESHISCHTYPEYGVATINLYCCRPRPEWPWQERLAEILGATDVRVRMFDRTVVSAVESAR